MSGPSRLGRKVTWRPRGEVRQAIGAAAQAYMAEGQPATIRELAARAGVGLIAAQQCVSNMLRAGELAATGTKAMPGVKRPVLLLVPVAAVAASEPAGRDLGRLLAGWSAKVRPPRT
ncbi:hypothetical protein MW290_21060 [Aquincola tertiaricarbonis]|uniref:Uncharacterized protein n=1 Tax=Aquincola tertiaricarbonis TaxID=391953 RepID=A0ABY4SKB7_AQUTE|nr:hypothetical protein [Aquincola tertiaricarbonis]URI11436.1 hypothetical protein MW290_21060 [Aquincola tertiaricarbonis]